MPEKNAIESFIEFHQPGVFQKSCSNQFEKWNARDRRKPCFMQQTHYCLYFFKSHNATACTLHCSTRHAFAPHHQIVRLFLSRPSVLKPNARLFRKPRLFRRPSVLKPNQRLFRKEQICLKPNPRLCIVIVMTLWSTGPSSAVYKSRHASQSILSGNWFQTGKVINQSRTGGLANWPSLSFEIWTIITTLPGH